MHKDDVIAAIRNYIKDCALENGWYEIVDTVWGNILLSYSNKKAGFKVRFIVKVDEIIYAKQYDNYKKPGRIVHIDLYEPDSLDVVRSLFEIQS